MIIRPYEKADREAVLSLLRLNTPVYFAPEEEKDFEEYLDHSREYYYVAETAEGLLACGGLNTAAEPSVIRISWDMVHPSAQGSGIGSRLTAFRIQRASEMPGISTLSVRTSQLAYRFYERFGFRLQEVAKDFWAPGLDMYRMECHVTEALTASKKYL